MRRLFACTLVFAFARTATAQEPSKWRKSHRAAHLTATVVGGAIYLGSEYVVKDKLAPAFCNWCVPGSIDTDVRDALRWNDTDRASQLSNLTGFVLAPVAAIGLVSVAGWDAGGDETTRWIDDALPVLESGVTAALLSQATKFAVGRQRPFVHFAEDPAHIASSDDNLSFYSGHTTLAFSLAVSSGMVVHYRNYRWEPVVWVTGLSLATATGYLRIAADKHYLSDVVVGAASGAIVGLAIPTLLHRDTLVEIHASPNSLAVAGKF